MYKKKYNLDKIYSVKNWKIVEVSNNSKERWFMKKRGMLYYLFAYFWSEVVDFSTDILNVLIKSIHH